VGEMIFKENIHPCPFMMFTFSKMLMQAGVLAAYGVLKAETEELTLGEKFLTKYVVVSLNLS